MRSEILTDDIVVGVSLATSEHVVRVACGTDKKEEDGGWRETRTASTTAPGMDCSVSDADELR